MVSPFHEAAVQAVADVDEVFAETLSLEFRSGATSDAERADLTIQARLKIHDQDVANVSGGRSADWKSEISAGGAQMIVARAAYPDLDLRKGDLVTASDRPGEPVFRVHTVDGRDIARLFVELTDK